MRVRHDALEDADAHPDQDAMASLARKVALLRDPRSYPQPVTHVQAIETHMSWVFLTEHHAWKLKKPVCLDEQDFRTLKARRFYCEEELRLNLRLAPRVYLGTVPLRQRADGSLALDGTGRVVDWLVRMHRLPAEAMLDHLLATRTATAGHMRRVAQRLSDFHRALPPAPLDAGALRRLLLGHIDAAQRTLCMPGAALPVRTVRRIGAVQRIFLRRRDALFARRVRQGRVVEGHGDLRPEHVYLGEPLAIIDCLEFSTRLRWQDAADEVGFLALECERAGAAELARSLIDAWRACSGDDAPEVLLHFYQSCRACVRARLAIQHLRAPGADPGKWRHRARQYVGLALRHLVRAGLWGADSPVACPPWGTPVRAPWEAAPAAPH